MSKNDFWGILIVLAVVLILVSLIPPDVFKAIIFAVFSGVLIFCIIKLRSTTTTWGLIGYFAGVCLSGWIAFRLIKYFAENYVWVSITIAIIMALVGFSFIIFMGVALVKAIYQALKNRNKTVNE